MSAFVTILAKDLRIRFSSVRELVFYLALPLVFTVALAGAGAGSIGAPLVLVRDTAQSPESVAALAGLKRDPGLAVRETDDPVELLDDGGAAMLVTLARGASAAQPLSVSVRFSPWHAASEETGRRVAAALRGESPPAGATEHASGGPAVAAAEPAAATSSPGQIVTWVLVPLLGLGANLLAERRRGTLGRILASPASGAAVTAGTAGAEMLAAFVQVGILALFGAAAFGLPWLRHPMELAALSAAFCAAGAALGSLLGAFCSTPRQAGSLGLAVAMVLAVLGGCWYPASQFPAGLRAAARWNPAGWAMDGFQAVLARGPAAAALQDAALLAAFAAAAFILAAAAGRARRAGRA
jgi:ABC-2 type transport system permease protein